MTPRILLRILRGMQMIDFVINPVSLSAFWLNLGSFSTFDKKPKATPGKDPEAQQKALDVALKLQAKIDAGGPEADTAKLQQILDRIIKHIGPENFARAQKASASQAAAGTEQ